MNPATILAAIEAARALIQFISTSVAEAKRQKEWTPEQEAQIDARIAEALEGKHWAIGERKD